MHCSLTVSRAVSAQSNDGKLRRLSISDASVAEEVCVRERQTAKKRSSPATEDEDGGQFCHRPKKEN